MSQVLQSARKSYEEAIRKVQDTRAAGAKLVLDQYEKYLVVARDTFQKEGNLDFLLAVMSEQKRFAAEKTVPAEAAADLPAVVQGLRALYQQAGVQAEAAAQEQTVTLAKRYVAGLEEMKKDLTKKGQIDDAIEVDTESKKIASQFGVFDRGVRQAVAPCSQCGGSGNTYQSGGTCSGCGGSGRCGTCGGSGRRTAGLAGGTKQCVACKGTGQCRQCGGAGKERIKEPCGACKGSGHITVTEDPVRTADTRGPRDTGGSGGGTTGGRTPRETPPPRETTTGESVPFRPLMSRAEIDAGMREYVDTMSSLDKNFKANQSVPVDFAEVMGNRGKYTGKLLRSEVKLLLGHERNVFVAPVDGSAAQKMLLIPYAQGAGQKAVSAAKKVGEGGLVTITYGVVNAGNTTLFDIQ